jgi:adenylylsulfate kinase-like enzyme
MGLIPNFTGINSPYELPENPFMRIRSDQEKTADSITAIVQGLENKIKV